MNKDAVENDMETLDPENWDDLRSLMHKMVDDAIDYVANVRDRKIWQEMPPPVVESFKSSCPKESSNAQEVYEELKTNVLPYPMGNVHPRFWAWYMGSGSMAGITGDFWASVINSNLGGGNHAAHKVEEQVLDWLKQIMRFPTTASGLLVSGGSMANYTCLAIARTAKAGYDIRKDGISPEDAGKMTVYASSEVHSSIQKAVELLGMGGKALRKIPVKDDYTIDTKSLRAQIALDRANGLKPICVVGTPGTVNTGAIDDLDKLADICQEENLWFHVDGAIGAIAILVDEVRGKLTGIDRADSLALDLHKWLHMPFEAGCVLVKDKAIHKSTFSLIPEYLAKNSRGVASGENWFSEYGLQLSRRFRALKIWMSFKEYGTDKFARMIAKNIAQAHYLGSLVDQDDQLELLAPIGLDIVCFRYNPGNLDVEELNALNKEIKIQLEERAIAIPGYTTLDGKYCIRIAIGNHRSISDDLKVLVESILSIGKEISSIN